MITTCRGAGNLVEIQPIGVCVVANLTKVIARASSKDRQFGVTQTTDHVVIDHCHGLV